MKNIILLLSLIFSVSGAFEINKSKTFTRELEPIKMSSSIFARIESSDKTEIQKVFQESIEGVKLGEICKNGAYRISPIYRHNKHNKRTFLGYQGNITFKCEFYDVDKFDTVISTLDEISDEKDKLLLTINPISWVVEKKIIQNSNKELELESLHYASSYKKFLSGVYKTACKIKKISLDSLSSPDYPRPMNGVMMRESRSQTTQPIKSNYTLKYRSSYKFECD